MSYDKYLDARGLNCPLPVLKAKLMLNRMSDNEILLVDATDPHSQVDFEAYCAKTEHHFLRCIVQDDVYSIYIRRAAEPSDSVV